jgi:serine/threonine protein kinase
MWALGIILYQLITNKLPFEAANYYDTMKLIRENEPASLPLTVSPFIKQIISQLLDKNPETRPNAEELLNISEIKPYITKII